MLAFLIVALLLAVFALIFALQNTNSVMLTYLVWHFQGSLALVVVVSLAAGVVITLLALIPTFIRGRLRVASHRRRESQLQDQLNEHRRQLDELSKQMEEQPEEKENEPTPSP
ncbi:MAG: lipopolysaccharide assembly LapA domain-containing protein [Anaerolineae bacterium]|jgi:putative membrane protein